jgi:hypothetical protein
MQRRAGGLGPPLKKGTVHDGAPTEDVPPAEFERGVTRAQKLID